MLGSPKSGESPTELAKWLAPRWRQKGRSSWAGNIRGKKTDAHLQLQIMWLLLLLLTHWSCSAELPPDGAGTLGNLKAGIRGREKQRLSENNSPFQDYLAGHTADSDPSWVGGSCAKHWWHHRINIFLNLSLHNASPIRALKTQTGRSTRPAWKVILIPRALNKRLSVYILTAVLHNEILIFRIELLLLRTHPVTSIFLGSGGGR